MAKATLPGSNRIKFGITAKLGILLATFGVLISGLTGYYTYYATRDILAKETTQDILQSTVILGRRFSTMANAVAQDVRFLSQIPVTYDAIGNGQSARTARQILAAQFKSMLSVHPEYFQVRFISARQNGIELVRVDRDIDGIKIIDGLDLQEKLQYPYVYETLRLAKDQVHFSRIFINREEGAHAGHKQPTLQVATPVIGNVGTAVGVIVINVDLKQMFSIIKSDFGSEYQLYLTNQKGDYLIHPDSNKTFGFDFGRRFLVQETFPSVSSIIDNHAPTAAVRTVSAQQHDGVIGGFSRIPFEEGDAGHFIVIGLTVPQNVVLAGADALAKNSSFIAIAFSLLATFLSILAALFYVRPLKRLAVAVQSFAETRQLTPVTVNSQDEIGLLAKNIGEMQKDTLAHLNDLNIRNEEMERRAQQDAQAMAELRRLEEQKQEALSRLQKIASQVPGVVFQFRLRPDGSSSVPYVSDAIREIYRLEPEEVREDASKIYTRIHPDDLDNYLDSIQVSARNLTPWTQEFRLAFEDGTVRWLFGNALPQREEDGSILSHGFITDITRRKNAEMELIAAKQAAEDASRDKSRFLSAASHDLRQPIQAINLFSDALSRTGLGEEQQKISEKLSLSVNNLGELLNALLDISKLDAGAIKPYPMAISSDELFGRIDAEFSVLAVQKGLRFKYCYPKKYMALYTDANLLMSLLGNLIGNAIKYTQRGGVLVGLRRRGNRALIQVWDTGIGIAPDHLDHVFEEYFQVGNIARDRTQGLGLGLSIVKRLAKLLDAELNCHSRLNRGSLFEFTLPLAEAPAPQDLRGVKQMDEADISSHLAGQRVVIVDDDSFVADAIKFGLKSTGMNVVTFCSAEDAVANPDITVADFYITDFRLPGMNGLQLLDAIQQRSSRPIRAVLLTGGMSPGSIELTQPSPWPVLLKPVALTELLSTMASQLAK